MAHTSTEGHILRPQDPKQKGISGADRAIFVSRDSLARAIQKTLSWLVAWALSTAQCLWAACLCGGTRAKPEDFLVASQIQTS